MIEGSARRGEFRRWARWVSATLLILIAVVLLIGMESVCWDEKVSKAMKIEEAANCFEFWLNRYQALLGVLAALIAGGLAWIGVQQQIKTANVQATIAQRQFAASAMDTIAARASKLREIEKLVREAAWSVNGAIGTRNKVMTEIRGLMIQRSQGINIDFITNSRFNDKLLAVGRAQKKVEAMINDLVKARDNAPLERIVLDEINTHIESFHFLMVSFWETQTVTHGTINIGDREKCPQASQQWLDFVDPIIKSHQFDRATVVIPQLRKSVKQLESLLNTTISEVEGRSR